MLRIKLVQYNSESLPIRIQDPLEQFNVFEIFVTNFDQDFTSISSPYWTDRCPFNINKIVHNLVFSIEELLKKFYYLFSDWIFSYIPTPVYLIFLWAITIIFFILFVLDNTQKIINPADGKVSKLPKGELLFFLQNSLSDVVASVLKANTSLVRNEYLSVLYFLFLFIFTCNIFGLLPYTFTLTSSFIVTFFLASTHFIGINIIGTYKQSWHFLNLFLPSGVPLFIAPFLVLIEVISYFAKVLSLSIRLFANMMSGHALLKILIGFAWVMCSTFNPLFIGAGFFPWLIVTLILFLEALIAFLQAYVFIVLVSIYLNDVTSSH